MAALGIEVADHGRDIRLEETVTDHKEREREIYRPDRRDRQGSMTGHKEESADHHSLAITGDPVRYYAAYQRAGIHEHQICRIEPSRFRGGPPETLFRVAKVKREQCQHRIERKSFPHFGGKEYGEPLRVFIHTFYVCSGI